MHHPPLRPLQRGGAARLVGRARRLAIATAGAVIRSRSHPLRERLIGRVESGDEQAGVIRRQVELTIRHYEEQLDQQRIGLVLRSTPPRGAATLPGPGGAVTGCELAAAPDGRGFRPKSPSTPPGQALPALTLDLKDVRAELDEVAVVRRYASPRRRAAAAALADLIHRRGLEGASAALMRWSEETSAAHLRKSPHVRLFSLRAGSAAGRGGNKKGATDSEFDVRRPGLPRSWPELARA